MTDESTEQEIQYDLDIWAAIDLGSNSFHLIVARIVNDQMIIIDSLKDMVRLASGLNEKNELSEESQKIALECLARFSQRLKGIAPQNIRIVGTNTLRRAKNSATFIRQIEATVGYPVDVIAGREEARLVYLGVSHSQAENDKNRLVIDIGGGSTEYIIGKGFNPTLTESLHMGCVSMTQKAFADGEINNVNFKKAELLAELELLSIERNYRAVGWEYATGSSGTIKAIASVLMEREGDHYNGITLAGLKWIKSVLIDQGKIDAINLPGLSANRVPVFPGGVAILLVSFQVLGIDTMNASEYALREGVIYDLQGRHAHEDVRGRTINHLIQQYHIDSTQAERVKETALYLFDKLPKKWRKTLNVHRPDLEWAAQLHEIGLSIAHSQYHKHGAYIIENADLPGFSRQEQKRLGLLIRAQRRKFPVQLFTALTDSCQQSMMRLAVILRLAILLHRDHSNTPVPAVDISITDTGLDITFDKEYMDAHPLTQTDLGFEKEFLSGLSLAVNFL